MSDDRELEELRREVAHLNERLSALEELLGAPEPEPVLQAEAEAEAWPAVTLYAPTPTASPPEPVGRPVQSFRRTATAREPERRELENLIGSTWLNRLGIIALFVATAFFLRYAFENDWIGPWGRVAIGLVAGAGVILWGERFRRRGYTAFSWSLDALGIGVLYLSLWAAFDHYELIPQWLALAAMVLVTATMTIRAVYLQAQPIALFALLAGYAAPVLVSLGEGQHVALFSYLLILNLGAFAVVRMRGWLPVALEAFLATTMILWGWRAFDYSSGLLEVTLGFASVFFLLFAVAPLVVRRLPESEAPGPASARLEPNILLLLPPANAGAYFLFARELLQTQGRPAQALVAAGIAAVAFGVGVGIGRRSSGGGSIRGLLQGLHWSLAVLFLAGAIELRFQTPWASVLLLLEALAVTAVGYLRRHRFALVLAALVLGLAVARLALYDQFDPSRLLLNARFGTYLLAVGVTLALWRAATLLVEDRRRELLWAATMTVNALALLALTLEVHHFFQSTGGLRPSRFANYHLVRDFAYSALWLIYGAGLMAVGFWRHLDVFRWQALGVIAATAVKAFVYDVAELEQVYRILSFFFLGVVLLVVSFAYQRDWLRLERAEKQGGG